MVKKIPDCYCPYCLLPEKSKELWIESESCRLWYHANCVGYEEWKEEEVATDTFICGICVSELHSLAAD